MAHALAPGMTFEKTITVSEAHAPKHLAGAGFYVFSTPAMVALVEETTLQGAQPYLAASENIVDTRLEVRHLAATPIGMQVTARCTLVDIDRRRLVFTAEVQDEVEQVAAGTHERFIVDATKQRDRVEKKAALNAR